MAEQTPIELFIAKYRKNMSTAIDQPVIDTRRPRTLKKAKDLIESQSTLDITAGIHEHDAWVMRVDPWSPDPGTALDPNMGFFSMPGTNYTVYCVILCCPLTIGLPLPGTDQLGAPSNTLGGFLIEQFPSFDGRVFDGSEGLPEVGDIVKVTYNGVNKTRGVCTGRTGLRWLPIVGGSYTPALSSFGSMAFQPGMMGNVSCNESAGTGTTNVPRFSYSELKTMRAPLQPLLEYIAAHESRGNYNAVNRGVGGDTPGGAKAVVGKNLTEMTIQEVLDFMKGGSRAAETGPGGQGSVGFLATGKYQLIPVTLNAAINSTGISKSTLYNVETQETLGVYLLLKKRRKLGSYLIGANNDSCEAAQAAALEWASLPLQYGRSNGCQRGYSAYCVGGANATGRLSRSPEEVIQKLQSARSAVTTNPVALQLITSKGSVVV
tara:strand:- start:45827 stop:47128 length:1302 start_codon:yes stop_codon:yes gene_type:complete